MFEQHNGFATIANCIDWNNCYKFVATQISHDIECAQIPKSLQGFSSRSWWKKRDHDLGTIIKNNNITDNDDDDDDDNNNNNNNNPVELQLTVNDKDTWKIIRKPKWKIIESVLGRSVVRVTSFIAFFTFKPDIRAINQ